MKSQAILTILLGILLFTSFGCVAENKYSPNKKEIILSSEFTDLDEDGLWDYGIYEFSEVSADGKVRIKRRFSVVASTSAEYTAFETLTDLALLDADGYLENFALQKKQAGDACANNIGLMTVNCIDVRTCANLCAGSSIACKKIAAEYPDLLGGSMIYFVQDDSYIDSTLLEDRNLVLRLRTAAEGEKNVYLGNIRDIIARVASLNANPLDFHPKLDLCQHSDYGVQDLITAAEKIGNYSTEVTGYTYIVTIDVEPILDEGLANEMNGIVIDDTIPLSAVPNPDSISSHQDVSTDIQGDNLAVRWSSSKISDVGYVFYYKFNSDTPPEEFADELMVPAVTLKTLDLSWLGTTDSLFLFFLSLTGNYYIALGAAVGITIALLLVIYNIIVLVISLGNAVIADRKLAYGLRRAFGKTRVKWKIDGVAAVILLVAGTYLSVYLAPEPFEEPSLVTSLEYLLSEPMAFAGTALILLGVLLAYTTVENLVKIILLERIYGVAVREERGKYLTDIRELRKKMDVLKKMIKQYAADEFEVSDEYDVLSSVSSDKLREFEKKMTTYSRSMLDEYLERVDSAIEKLEEKKKLADENWSKWSESISKMLSEHNEVYTSSLVTVPTSLRNWALAKYVKEAEEEGLIFEGNVIKRRKISPTALIKEMVSDGLIKGAIILRKGTVVSSWFEKERSATVATALLFKMKSYLSSLNKALDLGDLVSFVSVGDNTVFVVMKNDSYDSAVFINKDKFKDAVETWKKKIKMLGEE